MKAPARQPPSPWQLQQIIARAQATVQTLRSEHGVILDTDEAIAQALEEEQVGVDKLLLRLVQAQQEAEDHARVASERKAALDIRIARFKRRDRAIRETILQVMNVLGVKSWPDPEFSLSVKKAPPKVIITDEVQLPDELVNVVSTRIPDKAAILAALLASNQDGTSDEVIPGAVLANTANVLTIRTK